MRYFISTLLLFLMTAAMGQTVITGGDDLSDKPGTNLKERVPAEVEGEQVFTIGDLTSSSSINPGELSTVSAGKPEPQMSLEELQMLYVQTIMAEAAETMLVKVAFGLQVYYGPVISLVGIMGNVLCALVMFQERNRRISTCLYMGVLAILDSVPLAVSASFFFTDRLFNFTESKLYCQCAFYIWIVAATITYWIVVSMTVDRAYAVRNPLRARTWCTPRKGKIVMVIITLLSLIVNVPNFLIGITFKDGETTSCTLESGRTTTFWQFFYWAEMAIKVYIPFFLLLAMNVVIIHSIRNRSSLLNKYGDAGEKDKAMEKKMRNEETQITISLLLVAFTFLLLNLPWYIFQVIYLVKNPYGSGPEFASYLAYRMFASYLILTNHGINVFLYCLSGKKFRNDVTTLFCGQSRVKTSNTDSSNTHSTQT